MKYVQALKKAENLLQQAGIGEARTDSLLLLEYITGTDYGWYFLHQEEEMPTEQEKKYLHLLKERSRRIPLQYLTGEQEFMGLPFKVSPDALIPRQDTEILAEKSMKRVHSGDHVLDLCTGSGCLAVSIGHYCPEASVTATDISEKALSLAGENAAANNCRMEFIQSDLFASVKGKYDLIVSNPPYIRHDVIETLSPEVKDYEPLLALDGGADGLDFYRRIISGSREYLKKGGWLMLEIGADQGTAVRDLLSINGYRNISVIPDLAGLDRVAEGQM